MFLVFAVTISQKRERELQQANDAASNLAAQYEEKISTLESRIRQASLCVCMCVRMH